jgi:hypothetical protein
LTEAPAVLLLTGHASIESAVEVRDSSGTSSEGTRQTVSPCTDSEAWHWLHFAVSTT